ncbi:MAG: peptide-methionine (S)-S-oxide reductase MsrA [Longimicrobiales bacterium]|nr:peptide-methionine (S)-S-oxide reductase MsrA [Longimicrobiales bacterium]
MPDRRVERATLGGGCFWCLEAVYQEVEGVLGVQNGYAGGDLPDPTYRAVVTGRTGHAEVVQLVFDPEMIGYAELLRIFFTIHDPTTRDRQGADRGPQYRSIILTHDGDQAATAAEVIREVEGAGVWSDPIVTEVEPLERFFPAEAEHEEYYRRNREQPYCRIVIEPKVLAYRRAFASPLTWDEFRRRPTPEGGERVAWGSGPRAFGELRLPEGSAPHPVAVLVHGGCWSTTADLGYMRHLAAAFVDEGWATWSLAFPRVGEPGGGWPGTPVAAGRALDHLRHLSDRLPLDLDRVVIAGHSSGGHLALWLAARPGLPRSGEGGRLRGEAPLGVRGVIGFAPIVGLADFHTRVERGCPRSAVADLLGGDPADHPGRLSLADPGARLPLGVPHLLVSGGRDAIIPRAHLERYVEQARAADDLVHWRVISGAGHFEIVEPRTPAGSEAWGSVRDFLAEVAGGR